MDKYHSQPLWLEVDRNTNFDCIDAMKSLSGALRRGNSLCDIENIPGGN